MTDLSGFNSEDSAYEVHRETFRNLQYDFEKLAYLQGIADADALAKQLEEGVPMKDLMVPGGEKEVTADDFRHVLALLVSRGRITEDEAESLAEELGDWDPVEIRSRERREIRADETRCSKGEVTEDQ